MHVCAVSVWQILYAFSIRFFGYAFETSQSLCQDLFGRHAELHGIRNARCNAFRESSRRLTWDPSKLKLPPSRATFARVTQSNANKRDGSICSSSSIPLLFWILRQFSPLCSTWPLHNAVIHARESIAAGTIDIKQIRPWISRHEWSRRVIFAEYTRRRGDLNQSCAHSRRVNNQGYLQCVSVPRCCATSSALIDLLSSRHFLDRWDQVLPSGYKARSISGEFSDN